MRLACDNTVERQNRYLRNKYTQYLLGKHYTAPSSSVSIALDHMLCLSLIFPSLLSCRDNHCPRRSRAPLRRAGHAGEPVFGRGKSRKRGVLGLACWLLPAASLLSLLCFSHQAVLVSDRHMRPGACHKGTQKSVGLASQKCRCAVSSIRPALLPHLVRFWRL